MHLLSLSDGYCGIEKSFDVEECIVFDVGVYWAEGFLFNICSW